MNILIVYPKYKNTEQSFTDLFKFASKKSTFPPKESLIISTYLPITWERKHIDLNTEKLKRKDILWANYVFISAKEEQYNSAKQTIEKCNSLNRKIVASGSLFTEYDEEFDQIEHLVLDDFRITLPLLINDLENEEPKKVYHSNPFFELRKFTESYYSLKSISGLLSQNIRMTQA